jgi:biotin transport system substrate-specific component
MESILSRELVVNKSICRIIGVMSFVVLTSIGAFVRIPLPFTPVPLTLQTFFVLLSGAILGANLGALSQIIYLLLGAGGIPIFANAGSGSVYIFGPTGGYILGFVLASFFIGKVIKMRGKISYFGLFIWMCLADLIILLSGVLWLKALFGFNLSKAILVGLLPFLPVDLIKITVASSIFLNIYTRSKKIF